MKESGEMDWAKIEHAAQLLARARRVVALTGAGISRPSGIPDFRSDSGIWAQYDPMEVASLRSFRRDPRPFYGWYSMLHRTLQNAEPNPAHEALTMLQDTGRLEAVITQNIDGLHQRAGTREVYEMHGHNRSASCQECGMSVPFAVLLDDIRRQRVPYCSCGGAFKPDVVLFDEELPRGIFWLAQRAVERCDVLIVAGTSLEVFPVSDLPLAALRRGAKVIVVNLEETYIDKQAEVVLYEDVAEALPAIVNAMLAAATA